MWVRSARESGEAPSLATSRRFQTHRASADPGKGRRRFPSRGFGRDNNCAGQRRRGSGCRRSACPGSAEREPSRASQTPTRSEGWKEKQEQEVPTSPAAEGRCQGRSRAPAARRGWVRGAHSPPPAPRTPPVPPVPFSSSFRRSVVKAMRLRQDQAQTKGIEGQWLLFGFLSHSQT